MHTFVYERERKKEREREREREGERERESEGGLTVYSIVLLIGVLGWSIETSAFDLQI